MSKLQRLQSLYPYRSLNHNHSRLSNLSNKILTPSHILLRTGMNTMRFTANAAEASIVEKGSKDIIRVASIYAGCGTIASYLDMMYDGSVFVLKWSVPTPERFLMFAFCWGIAGCVSWLLFWSRSDILTRAAASRIRYGVADGTRTSIMAMSGAGMSLGLFSLYFDYIDYRTRRSQYSAAMRPSVMSAYADNSNNSGIGSPDGVIPPTDPTFDEDDDEEFNDENNTNDNDKIHDSMILGDQASNVLISSKTLRSSKAKITNKMGLNKNKNKNKTNNSNSNNNNSINGISKPEWNWENILSNMYEPCKVFFQNNMPVWCILGGMTGTVACTMMTRHIVLRGVGVSLGTNSIINVNNNNNNDSDNENNELNENEIKNNNNNKNNTEIELLRLRLK